MGNGTGKRRINLSKVSLFTAVALLALLFVFTSAGALSGFVSPFSQNGITTVYAAETGDFAGGDGNENNPFLIETAEQLDNVRNFLMRYILGDVIGGYSFKLIADIDLTEFLSEGGAGYNSGKGWKPIGNDDIALIGAFNGGGHTISGLWSNRPNEKYVGLFGYTFDTVIKNLNVKLSDKGITGLQYTGGIVGNFTTLNKNKGAASIANCSVIGSVTALVEYDTAKSVTLRQTAAYAGLIAGNITAATITNCYGSGTVTGLSTIGGITGCADSANITDCMFSGGIVSTAPAEWEVVCAAGIAGSCHGDTTLKNCFYYGVPTSDGRIAAIAGFNGKISPTDCTATTLLPPALYNCYYNKDVFNNPSNFIMLDEDMGKEIVTENCKGLSNTELTKANLTGFDFSVWGFDKDGSLILRSFGVAYDPPPPPNLTWLWITLGCALFGAAAVVAGIILYRRKKTEIVKETVTEIIEKEKEIIVEVPIIKKPLPDDLSEQERRVAELILKGKSQQKIADKIGVSDSTVKTYLTRIYSKAGVDGQKEFIARYL